jgi:hypothetical protein
MKKRGMLGIIGGAALLTVAPFSLQWSQDEVSLSLSSAIAQIERPLTATRIAGVHRRGYRRTYRRAAYVAAAAGGYGYGSYYGDSSPYYSSYRAPYYPSYYAPYYSSYPPQRYSIYYRPVRSSVRSIHYPYPPSRYSYYVRPFATVSSYDEYRVRL